jgi:hypothetical protein
MRLQLHPEDLAGELLDLVERAGELDPAALATAARVNLRLDDPDRAAEPLRGLAGFEDAERRIPARHRHAELAQDFLALVLVDLHCRGP